MGTAHHAHPSPASEIAQELDFSAGEAHYLRSKLQNPKPAYAASTTASSSTSITCFASSARRAAALRIRRVRPTVC